MSLFADKNELPSYFYVGERFKKTTNWDYYDALKYDLNLNELRKFSQILIKNLEFYIKDSNFILHKIKKNPFPSPSLSSYKSGIHYRVYILRRPKNLTPKLNNLFIPSNELRYDSNNLLMNRRLYLPNIHQRPSYQRHNHNKIRLIDFPDIKKIKYYSIYK